MHGQTCFAVSRELSYLFLVHVHIINLFIVSLIVTLKQFFPVPTRSQMHRAYPKSVIRKFGHGNIFMLLDATEIYAQVASMKTVNAILYSAYKHNSTVKLVVIQLVRSGMNPLVRDTLGALVTLFRLQLLTFLMIYRMEVWWRWTRVF